MAVITNCNQVDADFPQQTYVEPTIRSNRFPTPPIAWAFCTQVEDAWELDGLGPPYILMGGPLHPEGSYIEPTIGQIWPRIG